MCPLYMHGRLGRGLFSYFSIDVCSGGKYKNAEQCLIHFSTLLMVASKHAEG